MKAIVCDKLGNSLPDALSHFKQTTVPIPIPTSTQILVKIKFAALNFMGILAAQGKYQQKYSAPFIPGSEFSGIVMKIGSDVNNFKIGDKVAGFTRIGTIAQYIACESYHIFKIPHNMDMKHAAGFCCVYGTAYMALVQRSKLNESKTLLVTAASGGVGSASLQIGRAIGCKKIIGCVGSKYKAEIAKQNGANIVINYKENEKWGKELKKNAGIDVAIDMVGGDTTNQCLKCINWFGTIAIIGFTSGIIPKIKSNRVLLKNINLVGIAWGQNRVKGGYEEYRESVNKCLQFYNKGLIKPTIGKIYDFNLESVKHAFTDLSNRSSIGKLLIRIEPSLTASKL